MDRISYIYCQDLESQDHILFTQLPLKLDSDKEDKIIGVRFYCTTFPERRFYYELDVFKRKLEVQEGEIADDRLFQEVKRKQMNQLRRFNKSQKYVMNSQVVLYLSIISTLV